MSLEIYMYSLAHQLVYRHIQLQTNSVVIKLNKFINYISVALLSDFYIVFVEILFILPLHNFTQFFHSLHNVEKV